MSVNPRINITTINSTDTKTAYFNGACYYDPQIQRFLGEDPIGLRSRDFYFYRYVSNKPINFTDPSGKFIIFIPVLVELACGGTAITTIAVEITAFEAAAISGGAVLASHLPD